MTRFKKGDRVRFKTWNELLVGHECHQGNIIMNHKATVFLRRMEAELSGTYATVVDSTDDGYTTLQDTDKYTYTDDMFVPSYDGLHDGDTVLLRGADELTHWYGRDEYNAIKTPYLPIFGSMQDLLGTQVRVSDCTDETFHIEGDDVEFAYPVIVIDHIVRHTSGHNVGYKVDLSWVRGEARHVLLMRMLELTGASPEFTPPADHEPHAYLYFDKRIRYASYGDEQRDFNRSPYIELSVNDVLRGRLHRQPSAYTFRPGQRVRFKDWTDMVREYGVNEHGNIQISASCTFSKRMRPFCGTYATVGCLDSDGTPVLCQFSGPRRKSWHGGYPSDYTFTKDMLEPASTKERR